MAMLTNMVAVAATATALHLGPPVDAVPIPPADDPAVAIPSPLVVPFDADIVFVPRKEWDEITNRVEVLWTDHTNRTVRVAAAKARREEEAKAASRKPWRAPKVPNQAPYFGRRPR